MKKQNLRQLYSTLLIKKYNNIEDFFGNAAEMWLKKLYYLTKSGTG